MEIDDAILADIVRQFPELYDKGNKNFKDKNINENAWESIASTLNADVKSVQARWNVLRTKYTVERKKEKNIPSGSGAYKIWELYSAMSFLDKHISMRKATGNIMAQREKAQALTDTSPWSSLNIIMEDDSMSVDDSPIIPGSSKVLEESNQLSQEADTVEETNLNKQIAEEKAEIFKNDTPPLRKKRKKADETNVMSKLSSAFDKFNEYIKRKETSKEATPNNLEHESIMNFVKSIGNDLMQIENKKIRYRAEIDIMQIVKNALAEDMSDNDL